MNEEHESLLPPSIADTRFRTFEQIIQQLQSTDPGDWQHIYNPRLVPKQALHHLAQQFNVDGLRGWYLADTEEKQRDLVAKATLLNKKAGTAWSIKNALAAVGYLNAEIEPNPPLRYDGIARYNAEEVYAGKRLGGFIVHLDINHAPSTSEQVRLIALLIEEWRPATRVLLDLQVDGVSLFSGLLTYDGSIYYDGTQTYDGRQVFQEPPPELDHIVVGDTTAGTVSADSGGDTADSGQPEAEQLSADSSSPSGGESTGESSTEQSTVEPPPEQPSAAAFYDLRTLSAEDLGLRYNQAEYEITHEPGVGLRIEKPVGDTSWAGVSSIAFDAIAFDGSKGFRLLFSYSVVGQSYISSGFFGLADLNKPIVDGAQHQIYNWFSEQVYPSDSSPKVLYAAYLEPGGSTNLINHQDLAVQRSPAYGEVCLYPSPTSGFKEVCLSGYDQNGVLLTRVVYTFDPAVYSTTPVPDVLVPTFSCKQMTGLHFHLIEMEVTD